MEGTQTEAGKGGKGNKRTTGRKDANRQPAVMQPKIIVDRIDELVELYDKAKSAAEKSNDAIAKAAEDSGFLAAAVRKLVVAKASDKYEETKRLVEQQGDLFDEVGE